MIDIGACWVVTIGNIKQLLTLGRPTEIPEQDVYVCESVYDEARRQVRKLTREGLKKYSHSNAVTEDEIYFFRRLINPPKVCVW
jgi:protein polybromo-1